MEAPLFLADKVWTTVPFMHVKRDVHTQLYDVMVHLPPLLHQASSFSALIEQQPENQHHDDKMLLLRSELRHRYTVVSQQLQSWHDGLDSAWKESLALDLDHELLADETSSWPGYSWTFATTGHANVWITYWMAQLALHKVVSRVAAAPGALSSWFAMQADKDLAQARQAATNICASADYCTDSERGARSVMFYTMPMRMAMGFYSRMGMAAEEELACGASQRAVQSGLAVTESLVVDIPRESHGTVTFEKAVS